MLWIVASLQEHTWATTVVLLFLCFWCFSVYLPDQVVKDFIDVDLWFCWCFQEGTEINTTQWLLVTFISIYNADRDVSILTHWLLELSAKMHFLDIFVVCRLDLGQISFNLVENAFATRQLAFLATGIFRLRHVFTLFDFWNFFFAFPFSPFLFAAVIDLLLGLLAVKKLLRKHHRDGQILPWNSQV